MSAHAVEAVAQDRPPCKSRCMQSALVDSADQSQETVGQ